MKKLLATILALVMALGLCSVSWAEGEAYVADVDGVKYTSLQEAAYYAAQDGGTITLLRNIENAQPVEFRIARSVTLDLNGNNISFAVNQSVGGIGIIYESLWNEMTFTVTGKGTITANNNVATICVQAKPNSERITVNIGEDVTLVGQTGVLIDKYISNLPGGGSIVFNLAGKIQSTGNNYALSVNGTIKEQPVINVLGTASISGSTWGMYLAGNNKTTIESGAKVSGTLTGIEIRAGELAVKDGATVTGGTGTPAATANGNGSTVNNAAVAISQHTTVLPITVTIEGGVLTGGAALYQSSVQGTGAENVAISVTNGTFTGKVISDEITQFISGGTFSVPVGAGQLVDGLNYEVHTNAGYVYYSDVTTAVAAARANNAEVNTPGAEEDPFVIVWDYGYDGISVKVNSATGKIDPPELKRSGYTFKGWRVDGSNEVYTNDDISRMEAGQEGKTFTAVWSANSYYYYPSTTTDSKTDSPKTFDAGMGIYAVTAVLSVTGMAWVGKKRH